jgi:hypothetical protein
MVYFSIISFILIILLLMMMLAQAKMPGKVIKTVPMNFWQRVTFFRSSLLAIALGILLGRLSGWLPEALAIFATCFAVAIVCLPMNYTFTTHGVGVGRAIFRPWKEFSGISKQSDRVILEHPSFFGRLTLLIKPVELDSVLIRVKKSY